MSFEVYDSGARQVFESGMVRDTADDKTDYSLVYDGPMLDRWAEHMSKGAKKYTPRNWMLARGDEEAERFKASAARHFRQWMRGDQDEDHAAAVFFNINGHEYVKAREQEEWLAVSTETLPEADWTPPVKSQPAVYVSPPKKEIDSSMLRKLGPISGSDVQLAVRIDGGDELAEDYNYLRQRVHDLEAQLGAQIALTEAMYRH